MTGKTRTLALSLVMGLVLSAPALATTLADTLAIAYKTNPQLKAQQALLRSTDEAVIAARSALLPALNTSVGYSKVIDYTRYSNTNVNPRNPTATLSFNTTLTIQLWDFGKDRLTVEATRQRVLATRQALRVLEQQVLLLAVQGYMDVRRDQQFVRLAQNRVRVLREQVRAAEDRFEVGEVTRTDVAQAQSRLSAALSQLESARGNLDRSVNAYIAIVGQPPRNLRTPPAPPKIPGSPQAAEKVAMREHPSIMQAQFNAKVTELTFEASKKNIYPEFNAQIGHSVTRPVGSAERTVDQLSGSVTGTWQLYAGGRLLSEQRRDLALHQQALSNVQQAGYVVRQGVYDAYAALRAASASIAANREAVRAAQVAFEGVREEAKLGARTTLDTLDAEQELLTARTNLVTSIRDQYVATYQVLASMGLLTAKHLNLGVDVYDPDIYTREVTRKQLNPLGIKRVKIFDKLKKRRGE